MRTATATVEPITVWTRGGVPTRLVVGSERWTVVDTPTRLGPGPRVDGVRVSGEGWRLTARRVSDASTAVMDIMATEDGHVLLHAWH